MRSISLLISKKSLEGFEPLFIKKILSEIIKEEIGVDLGVKDIKVEDGFVMINKAGPLKTELMIRKSKIISELKKRLGKTTFDRRII